MPILLLGLAPLPRSEPMPDSPVSLATHLDSYLHEGTLDRLESIPLPHEERGYGRVTLRRDENLEIAGAHWRAGGQSKLHGHGASAASYVVLRGAIREERFIPVRGSYRHEIVFMRAGDRNFLPPGAIHRIHALAETVTLHAYTPPGDPNCEVPPEIMRRLRRTKMRARRNQLQCRAFVGYIGRSRDVVAAVRDLVDCWAEREANANRSGCPSLPIETLQEMRASGILAATMPEGLGGWGATLAQTAAAIRLLAQRAPATALALVMPLGNAASTRIPLACVDARLRSELRQGRRWIADQVNSGKILAVANSEPGAGGDLKNTRTVAQQGEDGIWRLTGRKSFATFGRDADYFLCAARRPAGSAGAGDVIDGFFVQREAPGLVIDDRWDPIGMRPTASVGLTLDHTPADALMGYPGCLEGVNARHWSTVLFAAVFLGVGEGALREAVKLTAPDAVWARATLADRALNLEAAAGFVEATALDERWPLPADAQERTRRAKTFAARVAVEAAVHASMIGGGRCYAPDHPVFRFLCDSLAGPLLRPPLPQAMDAIVRQLFAQ